MDIIIINNMCGIDANKSINQDTNESQNLLILARNAKRVAIILDIIEAPIPIMILRLNPFIVLTNMSLPIQSVPNKCSKDGGWLML